MCCVVLSSLTAALTTLCVTAFSLGAVLEEEYYDPSDNVSIDPLKDFNECLDDFVYDSLQEIRALCCKLQRIRQINWVHGVIAAFANPLLVITALFIQVLSAACCISRILTWHPPCEEPQDTDDIEHVTEVLRVASSAQPGDVLFLQNGALVCRPPSFIDAIKRMLFRDHASSEALRAVAQAVETAVQLTSTMTAADRERLKLQLKQGAEGLARLRPSFKGGIARVADAVQDRIAMREFDIE
jgi:hypothetical protein